MVFLHPGVQDPDRHAGARVTGRACLVGVDEGIGLHVFGVPRHVEVDAADVGRSRESPQPGGSHPARHAQHRVPMRNRAEPAAGPRQDPRSDAAHGRPEPREGPRLSRRERHLDERRAVALDRALHTGADDARMSLRRAEEQC